MQAFNDEPSFSRQAFFQNFTKSFQQGLTNISAEDLDPSKNSISNIIDKIVENLPSDRNQINKELDMVQKTCEMQEQKVYTRLCEYRNMDIYEEMNKVSSDLYDLRYMSFEELNKKFNEAIEKMKNFDEQQQQKNEFSMEEEVENFQVKAEEEEEETTLHSKFTYPNILQSSDGSLSERNENDDPGLENQEKKDVFTKTEDICFSGLVISRKTKKFPLDFNNIQNLLDENENSYNNLHSEMNILKEIDLNEGLSNSRLYE